MTDIRYYQDLAQRAETALFDSLFLADQLALGGDVAQAPRIPCGRLITASVAVLTAHRSTPQRANAGETKATRQSAATGVERIDVIPPEASTLTSPPVFVTQSVT